MSKITLAEGAAPDTPAADKVVVYAKADGLLYVKDDAGLETAAGVAAASTTVAGKIEIATAAETNTGTDATRAVSPDAIEDWEGSAQIITVGTLSSGDVTAQVSAASKTAAGKSELATTAEIDTGTDTTRSMPVDQFVASSRNVRYIAVRLIAAATDCAADTTIEGDIEALFTGTLVSIGAWNDTAGTTGTMVVDVHKGGTTVMATDKLDIDTGEKTTRTAATAPTITVSAVTAGDIFTYDIDSVHTTAAKGLVVWMGIRVT